MCGRGGGEKRRTIIHNMSELWKSFVFVDHAWLQVDFNERKHLHFRSRFSKAPRTSIPLLPQKPPVKPPLQQQQHELLGSAACAYSEQYCLDYAALHSIHRLHMFGSLPLFSSSIIYRELRWNQGADNRNAAGLQLPPLIIVRQLRSSSSAALQTN